MRGALIIHPFILAVSALFQFSKRRSTGENSYKCRDYNSYNETSGIKTDKHADSFKKRAENEYKAIDNNEVCKKKIAKSSIPVGDCYNQINSDFSNESIVDSEGNYHDSIDYVRKQNLIIHAHSARNRSQIKGRPISSEKTANCNWSSRVSNSDFDDSTDEDYFSLSESTNHSTKSGTIMMPSSR